MGYRVNVVLIGSENLSEARKAISEGRTVPYDDQVYEIWDDAVKVRNMAMIYFPGQ